MITKMIIDNIPFFTQLQGSWRPQRFANVTRGKAILLRNGGIKQIVISRGGEGVVT